jgi:hypothetical protein
MSCEKQERERCYWAAEVGGLMPLLHWLQLEERLEKPRNVTVTIRHLLDRFVSRFSVSVMLLLWRMPSSGLWRRVALVRTDVSEERISIIRVKIISSLIIFTLMIDAIRSSAASVVKRVTRRHTASIIVTAVKTTDLTCSSFGQLLQRPIKMELYLQSSIRLHSTLLNKSNTEIALTFTFFRVYVRYIRGVWAYIFSRVVYVHRVLTENIATGCHYHGTTCQL